MKTLTTMTAVAALIAGMSIAGAQTNDGKSSNPASINAAPTSEGNTGKSGMQPKATKDMKGSSKVMQGQQAQSENPSSINNKPTDSGSAAKSGMQPPATADMGAKSKKPATTGSGGQSNPTPNNKSAEPKKKAGDLQ